MTDDAETPSNEDKEGSKQLVLLIDVDNTLYSENELLSSSSVLQNTQQITNSQREQRGIESQIIRNTHLFGLQYFNLTSHQCDELHKVHGSTIEGIRNTVLFPNHEKVKEILGRFYKEVYDPIDYSCLILQTNGDGSSRSGYDHGTALQKRKDLAHFLKAISQRHVMYLASNSPKAHVLRVVRGMGLEDVNFAGILAPDCIEDDETMTIPNDGRTKTIPYPTKSSPMQYYRGILQRYPLKDNNIVLLDDSLTNIRAAASIGIKGIHIGTNYNNNSNPASRSLEEGLSEALGHIVDTKSYKFTDVQYLRAKNQVDFESIDPIVWSRLARELALRLQRKRDLRLKIVDLGAGMLSMLDLILYGGGSGDRVKESLLALTHEKNDANNESQRHFTTTQLEYYAYETNPNLLEACKSKLKTMGFREQQETSGEISFRKLASISMHFNSTEALNERMYPSAFNVDVVVYFRCVDFDSDANPPSNLDLIIGCCFADLFDPNHLTQSLLRIAGMDHTPVPLVYLPITFTGTTQFSPSHPFAKSCPSDTLAFRMYSESLERHGHNLDPYLIIKSMQSHGGSLLAQGQSKWIIDPEQNSYLWDTMLYFFGMSGGREILCNGLDSVGWIKRARMNKRKIIVSNTDLLFCLGVNDKPNNVCNNNFATKWQSGSNSDSSKQIQEIQFVAPYNVTTIHKKSHLGPNQVEIESLRSLISSGTELKVFKGMFESAALDVNIKGMADESMEYPLSYGYSLVGRVVACGPDVPDKDAILGRMVFVFSPHSTRVIIDRNAIQLVPDEFEAEDAIFMPSVETALSLVHDAHVRVGENVAVFGQGLIGLLVTSILSMQTINSSSCQFGSVTSFDTIDDRLAASSLMGATNALHPNFASAAGPFDVSIEVSGSPRALQSAIDNTCDNGRIIVGSWYGNSDVTLKLGIDFHRSHKTIQTSQVSNIPCALTGLWSKERRFALTWELVRLIRPSRLISTKLPLDKAQQAYELLDKGQEIAICFKY